MLTPVEARDLVNAIQSLDHTISDHEHVYDSDYKREITVAIYTGDNHEGYHPEVRKLIEEDS